MKKRAEAKAKPQAGRRRLDCVVLHPFQIEIIAAILSGKRVTICSGRHYGVRYAEQIAKDIKARMDEMQNAGIEFPERSGGKLQ